jgi:hypothetical protein
VFSLAAVRRFTGLNSNPGVLAAQIEIFSICGIISMVLNQSSDISHGPNANIVSFSFFNASYNARVPSFSTPKSSAFGDPL